MTKVIPPRAKLLPVHKRPRREKSQEELAAARQVKAERRTALTEAFNANQGGRPVEYLGKIHDNMVESLRMAGCTADQIATALGMQSIQILYTWLKVHQTFFEAWHRGGDEADAAVARKMFARATGYEHEAVKIMAVGGQVEIVPYTERYAPDTAAAIFWLTNRKPGAWKSRNSTELTGADGEPLQPPSIELVAVSAVKRPGE